MQNGTSSVSVSFNFLQSSVMSSYSNGSSLLLSLPLLRTLSLLFLSLYFQRLVVILLSIRFSCSNLYRTHSSIPIYFTIISDFMRSGVCNEVILLWQQIRQIGRKVSSYSDYQCYGRESVKTAIFDYNSIGLILMNSEAKIVFFLSLMLSLIVSYDIDCHEIGTSAHGVLKGCSILHDPLPLKWQAVITLSKDYEWHGQADLFYIYSDGQVPKTINCTSASNLPGPYKAGDNITIQHTCYSFKPALKQGDKVSFWAFNAHTSKFDDPLIFEFNIPVPKTEGRNIRLDEENDMA